MEKKDTGNYSTQLNFFILGYNELNSEVSGICKTVFQPTIFHVCLY